MASEVVKLPASMSMQERQEIVDLIVNFCSDRKRRQLEKAVQDSQRAIRVPSELLSIVDKKKLGA